jgi:hypothetical protein
MNHFSIKICLLIFFFPLLILIAFGCKEEIVYPKGGYEYPKYVEDKDTTFYCYPLKDVKSTRDSFETANWYSFLEAFDEGNLSIRPNDKPTFRMIYEGIPTAVITLMPDQIIIKKLIKGSFGNLPDTTRLSIKEKFDFNILERFFPLNDTSYKKRKKIYFDSLSTANPELLDPNYYKYLLDKAGVLSKSKFEYTSKRVPIKKKTFVYLVNQINKSGYWQLPFDNWCQNVPMDADGFTLEANTPKKYNIVSTPSCPGDTTRYIKACQEIIKYAKMDKEIRLIWDGRATTDEPIKVKELTLEELKEEPAPKPKKKKAK